VSAADPFKSAIRPLNHNNGDRIRYPVALIRGTLENRHATALSVTNSSQTPSRKTAGLVRNGRFKVLCELVPGENRLLLKSGDHEAQLVLNYVRQTNSHVVRVYYMTDKTADTSFQTPFPKQRQDYRAKLDTAMKLMQTMTAERMNDLGYGRRTFNLEFADSGKIAVHLLKGTETAEFYHKLNGDGLWYRVHKELMAASRPAAKVKNLVVTSYTRFDPATQVVFGQTALGGTNLALVGTGNLFTWPDYISEVQEALMDIRVIDTRVSANDSTGRHTLWAAASTTLGTTLHELGHLFALPHSNHPFDIMGYGFYRFSRVFTLVEAPTYDNPVKPMEFTDSQVPLFAPISAAALSLSPWLALDEPPPPATNATQIGFDPVENGLVVTSDRGVGYFGALENEVMKYFWAPPPGKPSPKRVVIPVRNIRWAVSTNDFQIVVLDDYGNCTKADFATLRGKPRDKKQTRQDPQR